MRTEIIVAVNPDYRTDVPGGVQAEPLAALITDDSYDLDN